MRYKFVRTTQSPLAMARVKHSRWLRGIFTFQFSQWPDDAAHTDHAPVWSKWSPGLNLRRPLPVYSTLKFNFVEPPLDWIAPYRAEITVCTFRCVRTLRLGAINKNLLQICVSLTGCCVCSSLARFASNAHSNIVCSSVYGVGMCSQIALSNVTPFINRSENNPLADWSAGEKYALSINGCA